MSEITDEELETWWEQADDLQYSKMMPYSRMGRDWQKLIAEVRALREAFPLMQKEVSKRGYMIEEQRAEIERLLSDNGHLSAGLAQLRRESGDRAKVLAQLKSEVEDVKILYGEGPVP